MKRPAATVTRASHAVRVTTTRRPAQPSNVDKVGLSDRAARVAGGKGTQTVMAGRVYDQTREQVRGAVMTLSNSIEQRPVLALLVTGAIGFMMGVLRPRR